ncbi:MAG TPA: DUF72 domain-containing protein [Burkholderiales bacterium]|nr:DUF72 domain-containing protein [Burkholderiales bacterium]
MPDLRIGISGWRYAGWRANFYPAKLPQRLELQYASANLNSIEINGSFYSLQRPEYYQQWYEETPEGFLFSVKAPRYITHIRRLREIEAPLANFFASGVFNLREKLGPLLWQFPPSFRFNADLFEHFLSLLPHDTEQALAIAYKREARMKGRARLAIDAKREIRHAVEIRHESFVDAAFIRLLRRYGVALVVADTAGNWPYREEVTANFMYMRLHGDKELYASGYDDAALDRWASRIKAWTQGGEPKDAHRITDLPLLKHASRDIYCYFDNDYKVRAPFDAKGLMDRLGVEWEHTLPEVKASRMAPSRSSAVREESLR